MSITSEDSVFLKKLFLSYREKNQYQDISASECYTAQGSIETVLKGLRPIALLPGEEYWPEGMRKKLNERHISIIEAFVIETDPLDKEDLLEKKDWTGKKKFYKRVTSWIIFREGSKEAAKELKKVSEISNKIEQCRKTGELLHYRHDDIEDFLKRNF
jgi:hypothetical protein